MQVLPTRRSALLEVRDLVIDYGSGPLFEPVSFCVREGERVAIQGGNGSGKSSLLKLLLGEQIPYMGDVRVAGDLVIATVPQEPGLLQGSLRAYARAAQIDESLFLTILRKLDFSRLQFEKDMADFSAGQKKKVLLAASLAKPAHLLLWDEPLNYIDILSRSQLEEAILRDRPAMVFVEHDLFFTQKVATHTVKLRERLARRPAKG
ncbi:ATP-binding cassette domain-containing protein [Luoshenia tenuis]|uniref:ATP-binding cassette domain-containing protein n=1 Tax=Luoshenia tenuis TaxID=2763654 RepID=UPI002016005E